jgi:hypothetical protein
MYKQAQQKKLPSNQAFADSLDKSIDPKRFENAEPRRAELYHKTIRRDKRLVSPELHFSLAWHGSPEPVVVLPLTAGRRGVRVASPQSSPD